MKKTSIEIISFTLVLFAFSFVCINTPKEAFAESIDVDSVPSTHSVTKPSVLILNDSYTVNVGEKFNVSSIELKVTPTNDYSVTFENGGNEIDFSKVGNHREEVIITDNESGFFSEVFINFEVIDTIKPVLTGIKNLTIKEGDSTQLRYPVKATKDSIKATDNADGDITRDIKISKIDINTPSTYILSYSITDSSNNTTVKQVKVKVKKFFTKCSTTMYVCSKELNINSEWKGGGIKLATLKYRTSLKVIGTVRGSSWVKVKLSDGSVGYCYKTTLSKDKPSKKYTPRGWKAGDDETPGDANLWKEDAWIPYGYYYEGHFTSWNKYLDV